MASAGHLPTPRFCSDGTGRDSYIVGAGRDSGDGTWALRQGHLVDTLKAHRAKVAAAYDAAYLACCQEQISSGYAFQRQPQHVPAAADAPKRGKRPAGRRTLLRKSWVPMGGAPRRVMSSHHAAGPPRVPARPNSASVRVELERALWLGNSLPPPGMTSVKEPTPPLQIRGAAIVRPLCAQRGGRSVASATPEDSSASTPKPKQRPKSAVVGGTRAPEASTESPKKQRPQSATVSRKPVAVSLEDWEDRKNLPQSPELTRPQASRQRPVSAPATRAHAKRPVSASAAPAGIRSCEEHIKKTDL